MSFTEEQRAIRATGIGGSEIGAVLGFSPFLRPIDIWRRKVWPDVDDGSDEPLHLRIGRKLEQSVAELYAEDCDATVTPGRMFRHPKHLICFATPDRLVVRDDDEGLLECKTTAAFYANQVWGPSWSDEIPDDYRAQCMWEMGSSGYRWTDVACLLHGREVRYYRVRFDDELFGLLMDGAMRFWRDHVVTQTPPPPDGSQSYTDWVRDYWPKQTRIERKPGNEMTAAWAKELLAVKAAQKHLEEEEEQLTQKLKTTIGDFEGIEGSDYVVTWKSNKDRVDVDWEAVAKQAGASSLLIEQHTRVRPGNRPLLCKSR
jgi:putative phage-type endonuclease